MAPSVPDSQNSMTASRFWRDHFRASRARALVLALPDSSDLSPAERAAIEKSIRQFQRGEAGEGRRVLRRGLAYWRATGDRYFIRALRLFIAEENRHSAYLLHFMQRHGIAPVRKHWVDSVFRVLRGLAGLELSLRMLVTAEIIAVPYYRALREATRSPLLRAICRRILQDEAAHLRYQASMLDRIGSGRGRSASWAVARLHRIFLTGTLIVVWIEHGAVFRAAGYTLARFACEAHEEFRVFARESAPDTSLRKAAAQRCRWAESRSRRERAPERSKDCSARRRR